jgi:hypothetical protein
MAFSQTYNNHRCQAQVSVRASGYGLQHGAYRWAYWTQVMVTGVKHRCQEQVLGTELGTGVRPRYPTQMSGTGVIHKYQPGYQQSQHRRGSR